MDPLERINTYTDTTYVLMLEAERREHEVWYTTLDGIHVLDGRVHAHARQVRFEQTGHLFFQVVREHDLPLDDVDIVWQRKDPPFDDMYLNSTQLLEAVSPKTFIMNHPRGLREANEKLYALNFPDCTPHTMVSANRDDILYFLKRVGGKAVIKPLNRSGGVGVFLLDAEDKNRNGLIESTTDEGRTYALVQEYLPRVVEGDKRIILLDGEPVGAVLRKPHPEDLRGNIHSGASTHATEITPKEREMVARIAPRLKQDGLYFVGLDVIGERITEINVTSPTGFQEITRLTGVQLEEQFVAFAEKKAKELRSS